MSGMTLIVKTIIRLLLGFIVVFSLSIILYGHTTPGGGFAGGVMLACAFILLVLAYGKKAVIGSFSEKLIKNWDCAALLSLFEILVIGLFGQVFFKHLFTEGTPMRLISGGSILWSNIAIGLRVSVFLFAAFMTLILFRITRER